MAGCRRSRASGVKNGPRNRMQRRNMNDRHDLYAVLGVEPSATFVEIRAAYQRRASVLHADRFDRTRAPQASAHASEMLRDLNEAYGTLRNAHLRRDYDLRHASRQLLVPNPARGRRAQPRHRPRTTPPARRRGRSLGRMAIVLGFGLLVLWAVLADMVQRRDAEAFLTSPPPSGATAGPLR